MIEDKLIKYTLYGASAIVLSEITYRYIAWWIKRCSELRASENDEEIADVIWINELTQDCAVKYPNNSPKYNHDGKNCKNMFCHPRNIGKIVSLIDKAKYSIDLSMYIFTSNELSMAFNRALKRGLKIRIISDQEMVYSSGSRITDLTKCGVPVRFPNSTSMLMHHKFCILDGPVRSRNLSKSKNIPQEKTKGILFTGSLNWTHQGFNANWENMIITSNVRLVEKFEQEYERMWLAFPSMDTKK